MGGDAPQVPWALVCRLLERSASLPGEGRGGKVRSIKAFSLAAFASVAVMAFVGASSAMATSTAACKIEVLECPPAQIYEESHIEAEALNSLLLTKTGVIHCKTGLALGTVLKLAEPPAKLAIHLSLFKFDGCELLLFGDDDTCLVTALENPLLLILKIGKNLGSGTVDNVKVLVKCGEKFHCIYTSAPNLHVKGGVAKGHSGFEGEEAELTTDESLLEEEELGDCPQESRWLAKFKVLLPLSIFISR